MAVSTHSVRSVRNVSSAMTSCTRTCGKGTRSASFVNETRLEISSALLVFSLSHIQTLTTFTSFQNYENLERHFNDKHFPCTQPVCQARKFVVFNTALDLKAHMVEDHGGDMSARDKKDARRIQA